MLGMPAPHAIPDGEYLVHQYSLRCYCRPELSIIDGELMVEHRSKDEMAERASGRRSA